MKNHHGRLVTVGCLLAALLLVLAARHELPAKAHASPRPAPTDTQTVAVNPQQAKQVRVAEVTQREFYPTVDAVGYVDFDQDHLAQVNSPYAGRVREVFARAGDKVERGQALFALDSPDLAQAEATLVSAAAARAQTGAALERAKGMAQVQANAPRDLEQAVADQQTAEGNYQAARRALRIFDKSDADIDRIAATRRVDGELRIESPIAGRVTARNVAPGDLVQPGSTPSPFSVSDEDSLWLVANVVDADAAQIQLGQSMTASLPALPGKPIDAHVDYVASSSDPSTHRVMLRAVLHTPPAGLRPQMLANFRIQTAEPSHHDALPVDAVVREGTGAMVVFTTTDGLRFTRHPVQVGVLQDGFYPVLAGLPPHERIATEGALFLSNALALQSQ
ncbi:efflux RND transporter periplasmic adaptor subunit [Dyella amyloliquefaciens]|uniref:efflux RND transporter periplasmic adaptor subunit n=1 Tax=Dyella amyloliquefaciens TaxID=1770545 RepID=UPI0013EEE5CA|nr:efflux RND transporter periplasmic adaptor subunit [Dyella amyloliquefaciens]